MAMAFQRTRERMRRSINKSPGIRFSSLGNMVLTYGVVKAPSWAAPSARAFSPNLVRI